MSTHFLHFVDVSFSYDHASVPLFDGLGVSFDEGWTGIIGANGTGKTTLLLLATGGLSPRDGTIRAPGSSLYCPQRTDDLPPFFHDFLEARDASAGELRGRLGIEEQWAERWESLSHGERKRAQIAIALWKEPPVLAIDEPTNHIDAETRRLLLRGLEGYRGIGLLVSHDRELLDRLCRRCLLIDPPRATLRPGGYTQASLLDTQEKRQRRERYERARDQERALQRKVAEKRREAEGSRRRLSKRTIDPRDRDAARRIDLARLSSKDRTVARQVSELEGRLDRASAAAASASAAKEHDLGLWFRSERVRRDILFSFPAADLPLGGDRVLAVPALVMYPRDRIALTGPNGCGKSTLLGHIVAQLMLPAGRLIYLPQEVSAEESARIMVDLRELKGTELGRAMTVVNLLGSDPDRILASVIPSPGEIRKVLIAVGIARVPHLIVMDEPTNHLDLPSIECLTAALAACECGLLLVSHDTRFNSDLTATRWEIEGEGSGRNVMRVASRAG